MDQSQTTFNTSDPIIVSRGLEKRFDGDLAVQDVTFTVPRGSIFGFIGPSGSGKTTTMRMLTGIYAPTAGEATVLGNNPMHFTRTTRMRIGYMPQHFVLYPHLTIWENLNFAASLYGMGFFRGKRLNQVLDFVELSHDKHKLARNASGGMQRRLSLAATLAHEPSLLFLDEPTAGVDPVLRLKFWDHFRELQKLGRTLFITTQYVNEATYCDLVGVMAEGRLLFVDTPVGLRHRAYGGDIVELVTEQPIDYGQMQVLGSLPSVRGHIVRTGPQTLRIVVDEASTAIPALLDWARAQNLPVKSIEEFVPPFDEIFVELVKPGVTNA